MCDKDVGKAGLPQDTVKECLSFLDQYHKTYTYSEKKDKAGDTRDYITTHSDEKTKFDSMTTKFEADLKTFPDPWGADIPVYYASFK